jgi:tRNA-dihydrouridine synthase B
MAGVTDRPFRHLCRSLGAGMVVSEMVSSNSLLWGSEKTKRRADHEGETGLPIIQIVGSDPDLLAQAAKYNVDRGAKIIDINMGCPAKKICNVMAGSALLKDEPLVGKILDSVVNAVDIPVTLKIRTGWDKQNKNAVNIAKIAEKAGIQMLSIHGRTRACGYSGDAEYDKIKEVKQSVDIPIIANGDIRTPEKAKYVLDYTEADGIMMGRAAQGNPWIFQQIQHYLTTGQELTPPNPQEVCKTLVQHMKNLYQFYGEQKGVRIARKHIAWYSKGIRNSSQFRQQIFKAEEAELQINFIESFFQQASYG